MPVAFQLVHVLFTQGLPTRCKSRGSAKVNLAIKAIVLDKSQSLDVICRHLVFDSALDDHTFVGLARQALLIAGPHPLLLPHVREHVDSRVGLDGGDLNGLKLVWVEFCRTLTLPLT